MTPEVKQAFLQAWEIISVYADDSASPAERVTTQKRVMQTLGGEETVASLGYLAGSVLLSMVGQATKSDRETWRQLIEQDLPAALDKM